MRALLWRRRQPAQRLRRHLLAPCEPLAAAVSSPRAHPRGCAAEPPSACRQAATAARAEGEAACADAAAEGGGLTCHTCGVGTGGAPPFADAQEQRRHFRSDLHRLNAKRRLRGQPTLSAEECERSLAAREDDASSLSGSGVKGWGSRCIKSWCGRG